MTGRRGRSGEEWSWQREQKSNHCRSPDGERARGFVGAAGGWLGRWVSREEGAPRGVSERPGALQGVDPQEGQVGRGFGGQFPREM